jgi:hypothetical protein
LLSCVAKQFKGRNSRRSRISMHISKDRETAHSWRAMDRVLGLYGLIKYRESRHIKSLSPLRCHIVTSSTACEVAFWSHFGTRTMQSDLGWRDSLCFMSPYSPKTRSMALQLCAVSRSLEMCIEIRLRLEFRPVNCLATQLNNSSSKTHYLACSR